MLMSGMVKDFTALFDLSKLNGSETSLNDLRNKGKAGRRPPIAPDAFRRQLSVGVQDGTIKFTNAGDVDVVASIYERAFLDEMAVAMGLYYVGLGWGNEEMDTLSIALTFAHDKGAMANLKDLWLGGNQIGDAGVTALAQSCARGALPQLEKLFLNNNQIGDAGVDALAKACAGGALASLDVLWVDNPEHPALKAACEARGIEIHRF